MNSQAIPLEEATFFPISPLLILPQTQGDFGIYLKHKSRFVLYAHPKEPFTQKHRQRLFDNGVEEIFILTKQKTEFERYMEVHLGSFLENDKLPIKERCKVFYRTSTDILKRTFQKKMPNNLDQEKYEDLFKFVTTGSKFLSREEALKSMAPLISHDYMTYSHSVHVFVFTLALLHSYSLDDKDLIQAGMGAILHDIGKTQIAKHVLNKPGKLNKEEWELIKTHPAKGAALCAKLPLEMTAMNCILFHHEKMDRSGYPSGISTIDLPLAVKAVSVADVYDALTSRRPYAPARSPFEALTIMREEMPGHFSPEMFKRLVVLLSGAEMI